MPLLKFPLGPALGFIPAKWLLGKFFRNNVRFLKDAQWWSAERTHEYQLHELRKILKLAYERTKFYRHIFDTVGFHPDDLQSLDYMHKLPTIDKQVIVENLEDMCTRNVNGKDVDFGSTGGTSGAPLHFYLDANRSSIEYAYLTTSWERTGYKLGIPMAVLRGRVVKADRNGFRHEYDPILRHHYYSSFHMSDENMARYLKHIGTIGPCFLHIYPSTIAALVRFVLRTGTHIPKNIEGAISESEIVYPQQRQMVEEILGCRLFSCYGHSEKLVLAAGCEHSDDYHVWPTYGYFELLDETGNRVTTPGKRGEIVGTGFINTVTPFIRYRTDDWATYVSDHCEACGRQHILIRDIRGHRTQEVLIAVDGSEVPWTALNMHDDTFINVRQFQFMQEIPGQAVLRIVPADGFGENDADRIRRNLGCRLDSRLTFTIELVEAIRLSTRGKVIYVDQRIQQAGIPANLGDNQERQSSRCFEQVSSNQSSLKRPVPVLITWDIDPYLDVSIENKKKALTQTRWLLRDLQIQSTLFFHARIVHHLSDDVQSLIEDGHEIGCHGLTHGDEENYNRMPEDMQRKYLCEATDILRMITGQDVSCFRGPRMKTSRITQKILVELGYIADCSVASQRVDFVSSNLVNIDWIFAPRLPYRPSNESAFRRGKQNVWVVPLSALILPFISSALYIFRVRVMKHLFRILYKESQRTGKPIVYLIHPFEFAPSMLRHKPENLSFAQEIRTHGFLVRERFFEKNCHERFRMNQELFKYMKSFPDVQFKTIRDYVSDTLIR